VPVAESEGLLLNLGGRRPQPVLLGFEHPSKRPSGLPAGAAALYDAHGNVLKLLGSEGAALKIDGRFVLELKEVRIVAESLVIECPDIHLGGEGGARVGTEAGPAQRVWAV
jgi:phage gp45-like